MERVPKHRRNLPRNSNSPTKRRSLRRKPIKRSNRSISDETLKLVKQSQDQSNQPSETWKEALIRDIGLNLTPDELILVYNFIYRQQKSQSDTSKLTFSKDQLIQELPEIANKLIPIKFEHTIRYFLNEKLD